MAGRRTKTRAQNEDRPLLPERFEKFFTRRGWTPRAHQLALLKHAEAGEDVLLIAPTGAGKTLAGFLPTLIDLDRPRNRRGLHTLYLSPLKALATDVARNLDIPISEMGLAVRAETRTGDTSMSKRQRQRRDPPDILLTTPEQLALLLASADARHLFADLKRVVIDELHSLAASKRGDLLSLDLARLRAIAPQMRTTGLSATVRDPNELRRWLVSQSEGALDHDNLEPDLRRKRASAFSHPALAHLVNAPPGAKPDISILDTTEHLPWSGHTTRHAIAEVYGLIRQAHMSLIFVNTRALAEFAFAELWRINEDKLPIALHHGSLDVGQRRRVEAAMAEGRLKAVVCTSTLDLGIDWGDVDLVINLGAPKGASRLLQRIGRANHRLDEPSRAILVPANRFEVLECRAAVDAAYAGEQDTAVARSGALDVLCQHILGMACAEPFFADDLFREVASAEPYRNLTREDFDAAVAFVAHGGYALASYERFAKIKQQQDGAWRIANGRVAQTYRMNVGTIVEADMLKVRLVRGREDKGAAYTGPLRRGGRILGQIEEYFLETLAPNDSFLFGGEILALQGIVEDEALVSRAHAEAPKIPSYDGGKFPLSTHLAARVRHLVANPKQWHELPEPVAEWLGLQAQRSALPPPGHLLVETFPRGNRFHLVAYPFEGRLAHQTLGMLLTRRMERAGLKPLGFFANDYAIGVWGASDIAAEIKAKHVSLAGLFSEDMLGDDLEAWLLESSLMKRSFRNCAIISGMIERNFPGREKTGRQITVSTDLIYDVLRRHEPDHILLRATRQDAALGLLDLPRLAAMLSRVRGRIMHKALKHVSPLAVPILLEIGREPVYGEAREAILAEASAALAREAAEE